MMEKKNDDIVMRILEQLNIKLSRAAVVIMLTDGTLTEEAPIEHYIVAKNVYEALHDKENAEKILKQNLTQNTFEIIYDLYKKETN